LQKADSLGVYQEIFNEFSLSGQYKETGLTPDIKHQYRLVLYNKEQEDSLTLFSETTTQQQWFSMDKLPLLILLLIILQFCSLLYSICS
jgi:hypothetical protein